MLIGIPKEIKNHEYRVGATPSVIRMLVEAGHRVLVQHEAGVKSGFQDAHYLAVGAQIAATAGEVYAAEMIVKVKEPQSSEFALLKEGQILFCYLHLAPDPVQTAELLKTKVVGIAYETVTDAKQRLPLLIPMSEIAGRLSIQVSATHLLVHNGGKGILLGGVPGVAPASIVILGGGVVGTEAARMALGLGAQVTVVDKDISRLRELDALYGHSLRTAFASSQTIEELVISSDIVIGAVLLPGKTAPKLITRGMVQKMSPGSLIVDVAIDQGGCAETSRPTTHTDPTYTVDGVLHYCVTNMPGACARTSTLALTNATLEYVLQLANKGWRLALSENRYLRDGLNVCLGNVTNPSVAQDLGYEYISPEDFL